MSSPLRWVIKLVSVFAAFVSVTVAGCGSPKRITGSVVDGSGLPIEGVLVQVANSEFKSLTDSKGGYLLDYAPGDLEIIFSKPGYATQRRNLNLAQKTSYPLDVTHLLEDPSIASMKSDLRNLVTAEQAYFADSVKYTTIVGAGGLMINMTTGNTNPVIALTADGWTATITNIHMTNPLVTCAIFIGSTAIAPASKEREPKCS